MNPPFFEALVSELGHVLHPYDADELPELIYCTDSDILRYLPTMAERRKWLRKAKAEITCRFIQERVDEIAEAWENEDEIGIDVLMAAFSEDLKLHKNLRPSQRQMWLRKAALAACGRSDEFTDNEPCVYFITADNNLIKIGFTTNLQSRLNSFQTAQPRQLKILLVLSGSRDDEQELHRRFAEFRVRGEWFRRCPEIEQFIECHATAREAYL